MLGYWDRPAETAEALRGGWMHTGDGGYMDEAGYVYLADRIKDMIITGGENVYSIEVENVLATARMAFHDGHNGGARLAICRVTE